MFQFKFQLGNGDLELFQKMLAERWLKMFSRQTERNFEPCYKKKSYTTTCSSFNRSKPGLKEFLLNLLNESKI